MATVRKLLKVLLVGAVVVASAVVVWAVVSLRADRPTTYEDIQEHFKYGSIGSEPGVSLLTPIGGVLPPYWVFKALPSVCSDKLPGGSGGYERFGFISEPGKDLPIGVSRRRRLGIDQVGLNCAVCHTATVRDAAGSAPRIVLGMPAQRLDLQAFVQFVLDCTLDNRLTADAVRGRLPKRGGPSLFERALLRVGLVDRLKITDARSAQPHRADSGRGGAALGPRPGRHLQSVQGGAVQLGSEPAVRRRADRRRRLSLALEPGAARGHAPALGWRQRFGGRAQSERGAWRRRDAGHGRSRRR